MFTPTREEYIGLAKQGKKVPVRRTIPADLETPVSAFLKLKSRGAAFLLESVEQGIQVGRYSFIGIAPHTSVALRNETVEIRKGRESRRVAVDREDPFSVVREELAASGASPDEPLPGPYAGAVGYIGYDMIRYFERVPVGESGEADLPDFQFLFPETVAVFDHVRSEIELITLPPDWEPESAYAAATGQIESIIGALESPLNLQRSHGAAEPRPSPEFNMTRDAFEENVRRAKEHILAGDAFQIVLSQRLRGKTGARPFQIYRALRILNPSPYMFFIDFGEFQLIGSSPEVLVKLHGRASTLCPIAGTRPRGQTAAEDEALEEELVSNEKERAEHTMLVDLGRNDLGRVCELGSIRTESLMHVEKYSHVMHLVSRITGTLRGDLDMFALLQAAFPAGTVTGAPKIRAMEILRALEDGRRGPYAGAVGYFGRQGDMDMCIAIRTLIVRGTEYIAQAGAGIVADSDPAQEYRETLDKIRALTKAVEIAEEGF
jgi:anthranilate synthase component 1